jgi:hypothetical protein
MLTQLRQQLIAEARLQNDEAVEQERSRSMEEMQVLRQSNQDMIANNYKMKTIIIEANAEAASNWLKLFNVEGQLAKATLTTIEEKEVKIGEPQERVEQLEGSLRDQETRLGSMKRAYNAFNDTFQEASAPSKSPGQKKKKIRMVICEQFHRLGARTYLQDHKDAEDEANLATSKAGSPGPRTGRVQG